jgi:hypothetical protein
MREKGEDPANFREKSDGEVGQNTGIAPLPL